MDNDMNYFRMLFEKSLNKTKKNKAIDAPSDEKGEEGAFKVFLAGTIDCDKGSIDWQHPLCDKIESNKTQKPITVYNPRRKEFPKNNSKECDRQIRWEHEKMDNADLIIMNILEDSQSPISLMEIGMYASSGKLVVFCKSGFYRYANIKIVCEKYGVPLIDSNDNERIYKVIIDSMQR